MPQVSETRAAVHGRSDEEILAWIDSVGGTRAFLEEAFSGMRDAFVAERAAGQSAVIEWDIATPDLGVMRFGVVVDQGFCRVQPGAAEQPGVVLSLDMPNFLRLLVGSLDGPDAVAAGALDVAGDRGLAMQIRQWFGASEQLD
ncbi:MAG: SCP2 sterol-binding domain-containing protein [Myxococcales bacterium]|nr:SCP2 sterol-binding domain-containing protein [Myxococcales bacterium]